jgi:pyruvate dehydrogenase E1 component alpha subunit/2-oxoisovalerate dehydrogenase E1 component
MYDAELYRSKDEVEQWKRRDPINLYVSRLREASLLTDADLSTLEAKIAIEIDEAVAFAESGEWEPLQDLTKDVYTPQGVVCEKGAL